MSSALDDLARSLATSMPRRGALRLLGSAVVAAALPGVHARPARAYGMPTCEPGTEELCSNGKGSDVCMPAGGNCCIFPDIVVGCRPGYRCGDSRNAPCICDGEECGSQCCNKNEQCDDDGTCTSCKAERRCGGKCCREGAVCRNESTGLCCVKTWRVCGSDQGNLKCCPPLDTCCFNNRKKTYTCCDKEHPCVNGRCQCKKGETPCGDDDCCTKNEDCSKGKCCPKGKVNCGGRCCDKEDCCGSKCCDGPSRICVNGKCCPGERLIGAGTRSARCCPPGTEAGSGLNRNTCCPENDPDCCRDGSVKLTCGKGKTCVSGTCRKL